VIANVLRVFLHGEQEPAAGASTEKLSKRQSQLLAMINKGQNNRDIAEELQINEHTRQGAFMALVPAPECQEPFASQPLGPHPGFALVVSLRRELVARVHTGCNSTEKTLPRPTRDAKPRS